MALLQAIVLDSAHMEASVGSESRTINRREPDCGEGWPSEKESRMLALDCDRWGVTASLSLHDFKRGKSGCELRTKSPIGSVR